MPSKSSIINTWTIIKEEVVYSGYRKIIRRQYVTPDNKTADFDLVQGNDSCCILAFTTDQKVILARQFRPGPSQVLNELPGGGIEKDEDPLLAAQRELAEETGYAGKLTLVAKTPIDAYSTAHRYHFIALDCTRSKEVNNDEHEFTEVLTMNLDQFRNHLASGQLTDIDTGYLGLEALKLL